MRIQHCTVKDNGFTLIEMLVVMSIFTVIIAITGKAFETVVKQTSVVAKSEGSNIEGAIGLEVFRHDLESAGFGLYTDVDVLPPTFSEAASAPASAYNDVTGGVPRAIVAGNNLLTTGVLANTDYLAIKATNLSSNSTGQKWTYVNGASNSTSRIWGTNDLTANDYVVVTRQYFKNSTLSRSLIYDSTHFAVKYLTAGNYTAPFAPASDGVQYYYYGVSGNNISPRTPFNRTDYLVKRVTGSVPSSCSPAAGVLYKTVMTQDTGNFTETPLLDCVADMQVVFGWNVTGITNDVNYYTNADNTSYLYDPVKIPVVTFPIDMSSPAYVRQHLKLIKVYLLAQDGGKDLNFTNTKTNMMVGDEELGEGDMTKTVNLTTADFKNYRWKLYRIVVKPKNLN